MSDTGDDRRPTARAQAVYRRLRSAGGVVGLPALEERVTELEDEVAESRGLEVALQAALTRAEAGLVPLLEAHEARRARRLEGGRGD